MGALLDAVPDGGADHTEHHRDLATAVEAGLQKATVTLSSAQILDLHNTPVTLVAAPGAGKYIRVHTVDLWYAYGTTTYTNGESWPTVGYAAYSTIVTLSLLGETASMTQLHPGANASNTYTLVENLAVVAGSGGASADGDGTLTIIAWYSIEDVP